VGDEEYLNDSAIAKPNDIGSGGSLMEWCESREYDLSDGMEALR
jgi:hypothetical protein